MAGPKVYIAGGNSREVFLINHEGEQLVLKVSKHQSDHQSTRHLMEAIALDVVRDLPTSLSRFLESVFFFEPRIKFQSIDV